MPLISDFLTNGGLTHNFKVQFEGTLPNRPEIVSNANLLIRAIENEFAALTGWFATPADKFGPDQRQVVNLSLGDLPFKPFPGGRNTGYPNPIDLDAQNLQGNKFGPDWGPDRVAMLFVENYSQVLMSIGAKWPLETSTAQALARWCAIQRFAEGYYSYTQDAPLVQKWLNSKRDDFVNHPGDPADDVSVGGALAFLFYLSDQLGFSASQIIQAGGPTLAATYKTLTGDSNDPFPAFAATLACGFPPGGTPCVLAATIKDNPFPLLSLSFVVRKSSFTADEVAAATGAFLAAFFLEVDGITKDDFVAKGIAIAKFTGAFTSIPGVAFTQGADVQVLCPRRFLMPFAVGFDSESLDAFPDTGSVTLDLQTFLTLPVDKPIKCTNASTQFTLVAGVPFLKEACGKVINVTFDKGGNLESFELDSCGGQTYQFKSTEPGVADLALRACRDYLTLCVTSDRHGITRMAVSCC